MHISIYTIYFIFWYCVRNLNSKSEGTHLHPYIIGVICQVSVGKLRVLSVILGFGTLRSVWHSSRRKYWNRGRWARKTGSNGSGIWQKDMSQNIVKRLVFLGPTGTVHWHFYKKKKTLWDYWRQDRRGEARVKGNGKIVTRGSGNNRHWGNLWCKITTGRDMGPALIPLGLMSPSHDDAEPLLFDS